MHGPGIKFGQLCHTGGNHDTRCKSEQGVWQVGCCGAGRGGHPAPVARCPTRALSSTASDVESIATTMTSKTQHTGGPLQRKSMLPKQPVVSGGPLQRKSMLPKQPVVSGGASSAKAQVDTWHVGGPPQRKSKLSKNLVVPGRASSAKALATSFDVARCADLGGMQCSLPASSRHAGFDARTRHVNVEM